MVVLLSILRRVLRKLFRNFRTPGEGHADDLSKDELFNQQRRGQRERQTAEYDQTLQHCFHGCLRVLADGRSTLRTMAIGLTHKDLPLTPDRGTCPLERGRVHGDTTLSVRASGLPCD